MDKSKDVWDIANHLKLRILFDTLRDEGFVARHNYQCCQGCGVHAIQRLSQPGAPYIFYHNQDNEALLDGGMLHIAYGICGKPDATDEEREAVARRLVDVANTMGLITEWDGTASHRVGLLPRYDA